MKSEQRNEPSKLSQLCNLIIMPQINLTLEEHQHLTRLVARSYDNNYRNDQYDTDTYDSMADKVFDAVNNLLIDDF